MYVLSLTPLTHTAFPTMASSEVINLEKEKQLKIMVCEPGDKICIQLTDGSAEVFGSQLVLNEDYEFSYFSSISLFTWHGCTITIKKEASEGSSYKLSDFKQISKMVDLHKYLEEFRISAFESDKNHPICLIVGPSDAGKSTLCRFLLNYAVNVGRRPVFIDLDVGQGSLSVTGTFGIASVDEPSDIYGRFREQATSVYYFGYNSPGHNMKLYKLMLEKVGKSLNKRLSQDYHSRNSGVIINTCGWIDGGGYKLIKDAVKFLNINIVLVLSNSSLYYKLKNDVTCKTKIVRVPDIKGAVVRNKSVRITSRNAKVYEYFYGFTGKFQPYTIKVNFDDLIIFKANNLSNKKSHDVQNSNIISVLIEPSILYHIFGLSYADNVKDILLSSVYGFICIVALDMDSKIASILSPKPGPLPTKFLLMGDIMLEPR